MTHHKRATPHTLETAHAVGRCARESAVVIWAAAEREGHCAHTVSGTAADGALTSAEWDVSGASSLWDLVFLEREGLLRRRRHGGASSVVPDRCGWCR